MVSQYKFSQYKLDSADFQLLDLISWHIHQLYCRLTLKVCFYFRICFYYFHRRISSKTIFCYQSQVTQCQRKTHILPRKTQSIDLSSHSFIEVVPVLISFVIVPVLIYPLQIHFLPLLLDNLWDGCVLISKLCFFGLSYFNYQLDGCWCQNSSFLRYT